jgi:hypothetical protein
MIILVSRTNLDPTLAHVGKKLTLPFDGTYEPLWLPASSHLPIPDYIYPQSSCKVAHLAGFKTMRRQEHQAPDAKDLRECNRRRPGSMQNLFLIARQWMNIRAS